MWWSRDIRNQKQETEIKPVEERLMQIVRVTRVKNKILIKKKSLRLQIVTSFKRKPPFLFLSFPDSYFVGPSSSVRAKLELHGVISNANVRGLFLWSFRASTYVSPRGKSSWKLRLFLKNYSWYYRNTRIVDSQKTTEDFGLFQIKIMPRFCAVFSTASLKPYANLRLSFREPMTATLPYSSVP